MSEDDPITRREFAAGIKRVTDRLDTMNGSVAENTLFRVQQKTVYWVLGVAWASVLIPVTAIAIAVMA